MMPRRRAVLLVHMLTVLLLTATGGGLMMVGLVSILRGQKRVAEFGNRYTVLNDFLRCVSRDVRMATTAALEPDEEGGPRHTLVLGTPPNQVTYRFHDGRVERNGFEGDSVSTKRWAPMSATVSISGDRQPVGRTIVSVRVSWFRNGADDPEPDRRFDLTVRCAGELGDDSD